MNTELINKALALCSEIEERQAQLKEILNSMISVEPVSDLVDQSDESDDSDRSDESDESDLSDKSEPIEAAIAPEPEPAPEPEVIPAPQPSGDLRKAFTINDRFRFRRELFGGDDKAMLDVIAHLSESQSYGDALAYIDTLGWSADNEAAGEFKEIVSTFFNGYRL
ncbi:MAG: hypothetical protein K2M54_00540 [Muribaculaceae bacterium]|nr:hypothetical protein [Muribaculaceae bacterium]